MISDSGQNLTFLLSLPRSGSTLLSVLLNQLPQICCPPEPWLALKAVTLATPGLPSQVWDDSVATQAVQEFFRRKFPLKPVRCLLTCAYNDRLQSEKKTLFVDKTPRYYHILGILEELFPQARFIWLLRHPLDVAVSYRETWGLGADELTGKKFQSASYDLLQGLPLLADWFSQTAPNKHVIRYEDLVAAPDETMRTLSEFLQIPKPRLQVSDALSKQSLEKFKASSVGDPNIHETRSIHNHSVGRWKSSLTNDELSAYLEALGLEIFERLGYADVSAEVKRRHLTVPDEKSATALRSVRLAQTWDENATLKARLEASEGHARTMLETLHQFEASHRELQRLSEYQAAQLETAQEQAAYIKSLETERDSYRTNYTRVVSESERHLASLAEQASFIAQLQSSLAEKDQALTHLHQQMDEKSAYIASLAAERDALRQDNERILAESRRHLDSLAEQDRFISQLKKQRADLEVFVASLRDQLDTLGRTTVEQAAYIDTLKAECEQSKREHASTLSQLAAEPRTSTEVIQKQTSYIASLEAEREQLQHDNTRILAESKRHQASLAEQEHFIVQLKQQNAKLVAETESLRAQLDKLSHTVVEQTSCIDALKAECALTKREYASLEQQLAADKAQAASEYEKLQARLEKASAHALAQEQDIVLLKKMHARQASHTRYLIDTLSPQHTSHPPPPASS